MTAIGQNLNAAQWYRGLISQLGQQLELDDEIVEFWRDHDELGPLQRWTLAIRQVVMSRYPGPVVIFIDEIDAVRSLPFSTDEFFAAIREFYNRRAEDEELNRLTFCLLGVASPSDLIRDIRTTPFNIGQRIELHDFTESETASLSPGLKCDEKTASQALKRVIFWTGGHPYLTQRLCQAVAQTDPQSAIRNPRSIDRLCEELFFSPRAQERDDNLLFVRERLLRSGADPAGLLHLYERVLRRRRVRDDETNPLVTLLRLAGVAGVERGYLRERNRIYSRVFDRQWVRNNMPDAELRRQRAAFQRGLLRAAAVAAVIIVAIAALALFAFQQRDAAERARAQALSREQAANAVVLLPVDPELSVLLATEAARIAPTMQAETALRQTLPESHVQAVARGHTDAVSLAAFSPDGRWVVTGSFDRTARVWEAATGRCLAELRGHSGWVYCASFSSDNKTVVTASKDDPVARIWEAATGRCLAELRGHTAPVNWAAFSPDGKSVVTASDDKTARVWETGTGKELAVLRGHQDVLWGAAFSPDGQRIVTGGRDRTGHLWSTRNWQNVSQLHGDTEFGGMLLFSRDGHWLTTKSGDAVHVWEMKTGRHLTELRGHPSKALAAAFSPGGDLIVTGGDDGTARLWEAATGRSLKELRGHTSKVVSVAFSPDGKLVLTSSWDGTSRIWELSTGQTWKELRGQPLGRGLAGHAGFSPDGKWVVTSGGHEARVWAVKRDDAANELRGHADHLLSAAFSPDGKLIATASKDKTARLWDLRTGQSLRELRGHTSGVASIGFSRDGRRIVTVSWDNTARIWDSATGESLLELRGHTNRVLHASFSPDDSRVATASTDQTARIWETKTGRMLIELRGHTDRVDSVNFSPDGNHVITASWDRTARIWDASAVRPVVSYEHPSEVTSAVFSPDGKWIVTGSHDGVARIWEAGAGSLVRELHGHKAHLTSVNFSPDGEFVAASSVDGTARVWKTSTGQDVAQIRGHSDEVWSAAFSPDGNYIVTASYDKTARIYFCEVCRPLPELLELARTKMTRSLTREERRKYLHEP
jgi:WD40 repeat protein